MIVKFYEMLRNFPYFNMNRAPKPSTTFPPEPKGAEDCSTKAKNLLLASRQIHRNQIRPGVPHQNLIGLVRRTKARHFIPQSKRQYLPKETKPSTNRHIQTDDELPFANIKHSYRIQRGTVESSEELARQLKVEYIHKESEELFKECSMIKNEDPSCWHKADGNRKLVYYWTTMNTICPDPIAFKNFMMFYISRNKRTTKMPHDKIHRKCFSIWKQMRHHEKLPFIAESLICHFSKLSSPSSRKLESEIKNFFVASRKE